MRISSIVIFLSIYFLTLACTSERQNDDKPLEYQNPLSNANHYGIDIEDASTVKISNLFDELDYIRLETNDTLLISGIRKLIVQDGLIYISSNNAILTFDLSGKFVRKLDKKGKGPDEYLSISDFIIDGENQMIEIFDSRAKTMRYYNFNGDKVGEVFIGFDAQSFIKLKDKYLFYCGNIIGDLNKYKLVYYDIDENEIIKQYIPIDLKEADYLHIGDDMNFSVFNDSITFWHSLNDTIYHVDEENINPRIIVESGENKIPESLFEADYPSIVQFASKLHNSDFIYGTVNFIENDSFILLGVRQKSKLYHVIYQKESDQITVADSIHFDLIMENFIEPTNYSNLPIYCDGSSVYYVVNPFEFIPKLDSLKKSYDPDQWDEIIQRYPVINSLYNNSTENDNPYILVFN